jgi:hypothetical protein
MLMAKAKVMPGYCETIPRCEFSYYALGTMCNEDKVMISEEKV